MATTIVTTEVAVITREYYRMPWTVTELGAVVDPTMLLVECALVVTETPPAPSDWKAGSWEVDVDPATGLTAYLARAFVGDALADHPLERGTTYDVWQRVTDSPERPARLVGRIKGV